MAVMVHSRRAGGEESLCYCLTESNVNPHTGNPIVYGLFGTQEQRPSGFTRTILWLLLRWRRSRRVEVERYCNGYKVYKWLPMFRYHSASGVNDEREV